MDEIAVLYFVLNGTHYRVKVFDNAIGVERQPNGPNVFYDRDDDTDLFDGRSWCLEELQALVTLYEMESDPNK